MFVSRFGSHIHRGLRLLALAAVVGVLALAPATRQAALADNGITAMNLHDYVDGSNELHIVGEVRNDSGQAVELVNIQVAFVDAAGKSFGGSQGYAEVSVLQPGESSSFDVTKFPAPDGLARYNLHMTWSKADHALVSGLVVVNDPPFDSGDGFVHISGSVQNSGTTVAKSVTAIATYYQDDGTVAFIWDDHTVPSMLSPGESARFELVSRVHPYSTYRLQVVGRP